MIVLGNNVTNNKYLGEIYFVCSYIAEVEKTSESRKDTKIGQNYLLLNSPVKIDLGATLTYELSRL